MISTNRPPSPPCPPRNPHCNGEPVGASIDSWIYLSILAILGSILVLKKLKIIK